MTTNQEAMQKLVAAINGPLGGNEFAASLVSQHRLNGNLSDKQWPWVHKLLAPEPAPVGDKAFPRIPAIFELAGTHLKWPKITVTTWHGKEIDVLRFGRAGERSRYHGQIMINSDGYYDERTYYGRIDAAGSFYPAKDTHPALAEILVSMNISIQDFAYQQGLATGNCIFCSLTLSDERSVTAGFGKKCASNYGLPWGGK